MEKPTRIEINCSTGETSIIELTEEELEQLKATREQAELDRAEAQTQAENKAAARLVILDKLGLTADEASILLG
jgi:hypothetical protein